MMFFDLLSNRLIQAGFAFFVLVVGGSLLYSWHVQRAIDVELERTNRAGQTLEQKNEIRTEKTAIQNVEGDSPDFVGKNDENANAPMSEKTGAPLDEGQNISDASGPDETTEIVEDAPVSPFGFGAYPKIPSGFPKPNIFKTPSRSAEEELLDRVFVQLWKDGIHASGLSYQQSNGLIYPTIRGTIYVKWGQWADGTRYIARMKGHPTDTFSLRNARFEDDIPSGIKILDFSEGINPYEYLNLK